MSLSPKTRRVLFILGASAALFFLVYMLFLQDAHLPQSESTGGISSRQIDSEKSNPKGAADSLPSPVSKISAIIRVVENGNEENSIEGATVLLSGAPSQTAAWSRDIKTFTTDGEGKVELRDLAAGSWGLQIVAKGFLGAEGVFQIGPEPEKNSLTVELLAFSSIHGIVRDSAGASVDTAVWQLFVSPEIQYSDELLHPDDRGLAKAVRGTSDALGRFEIPVAPPNTALRIFFEHPKRGRAEIELDPLRPGEAKELAVTLQAPTSLHGFVVDPGTKEAPSTVELFDLSSHIFLGEARVECSPDRSFRFEHVRPGLKKLAYQRIAGTMVEIGSLVVTADAGQDVDVGTIPVNRTSLRILASAMAPIQGARQVEINAILSEIKDGKYEFPNSSFFKNSIPLEQQIEIRGFPPGSLQLSGLLSKEDSIARDSEIPPASLREEFSGDRTVQLVFKAPPKGETGTIVARLEFPVDAAMEPGRIRAFLLQNGKFFPGLGAIQGGERILAQFEKIPLGEYELQVTIPGYRSRIPGVEIGAGSPNAMVRVHDWEKSPSIYGRVLEKSGKPVAGANVYLAGPELLLRDRASRYLMRTQSDENGAYRFEEIPYSTALSLLALRNPGFKPILGTRTVPTSVVLGGGVFDVLISD